MVKILIINGHELYPFAQGLLNNTLFNQYIDRLKGNYEIKTTVIQDGYDISEEQKKFQWADIIIIQTPIYWMSIPAMLKNYIDKVFAYDIFFARTPNYGHGGLMKDKKYMLSTTWNAPEYAFNDKDTFFEGRSVDDALIHIHKTMEYCGMKRLRTFSCHSVVSDPDIEKFTSNLDNHLQKVFNICIKI